MKNLPVYIEEQYNELQEEVRSIMAEVSFRVETEKLKGKWLIGNAIVNFHPERKYGEAVIKRLSSSLGIGERDLYYCVKFTEKFPNLLDKHNEPILEEIEVEGKTPTWTRVKNELLINGTGCKHKDTKVKKTEIEVCTCCGKVMARREL